MHRAYCLVSGGNIITKGLIHQMNLLAFFAFVGVLMLFWSVSVLEQKVNDLESQLRDKANPPPKE
jgi:hypothetical protein